MAKIERKNMTQSVDGKVTRQASEDSSNGQKFSWWHAQDNASLAKELSATIKFIQAHQGDRLEQLTVSTRLYGNSNAYNQLGAAFTRASSVSSNPMSSRISFNLVAAVVDTLVAKMAKNKIIPTFITQGGTWGMQKKAELLSKFIDGKFYEQKVHDKKVWAVRDAAVWGDGLVHVYRDKYDRAAVERVLPHEILVDLVESIVSDPRQIHRVKVVDRSLLLEEFPDHEEKIMKAMPASPQDLGSSHTAADLITVAESWHLSSGPKAKDGLRAIVIVDNDTCLLDDKWDKEYFPFPHLQYSKRMIGWFGQGAAERLQNLQGEINRLMILIQKSMWMGGSFKILSHILDKVPPQHFSNEIASIIKWSGDIKPEFIAPPMIQQDIYPYVDTLIAKGFQQEGISQLNASSLKPQGVNSGAALRTWDDIGEDRQLWIAQQIENFELEIARQMIDVVKDVAKDKGSYDVNYPNANFIETIDWTDVQLEKDEYYLKSFPTSELPEEPSARLQTVTEYAQAGWISPQAARRLMRTEDLEMSDALANAAESLICKSIEAIIYDGDKANDHRPNNRWNLDLAKTLSIQYYNFALLNNCPEKRLSELDNFMAYLDDEIGLTMPPPPMPMAGAPANPTQTPTSELLSNVNPQGQA